MCSVASRVARPGWRRCPWVAVDHPYLLTVLGHVLWACPSLGLGARGLGEQPSRRAHLRRMQEARGPPAQARWPLIQASVCPCMQALPTRSGTRASPNYGTVGRWEWSQPSRQPLKTPCKAFTGHVYDTCTSQWSWLVFDLRATSGSSAGLSYQRNARMARLERNASDRTGSDQDRIKIGSDRRSGALRLVGSDARFRLDYNSLFICGTDKHVCPPRTRGGVVICGTDNHVCPPRPRRRPMNE